jgi:hypothetical protein
MKTTAVSNPAIKINPVLCVMLVPIFFLFFYRVIITKPPGSMSWGILGTTAEKTLNMTYYSLLRYQSAFSRIIIFMLISLVLKVNKKTPYFASNVKNSDISVI